MVTAFSSSRWGVRWPSFLILASIISTLLDSLPASEAIEDGGFPVGEILIEDNGVCDRGQFQCMQLNLNQILSINDWNRRPRECIPQEYRCDGRHDCQDGSDEVECFVQLPRRNSFRCFVGDAFDMRVEDCIARDRANPETHPHETSRSVSEMKEWVCSKMEKPDGTIIRDCLRLYTGGDLFRVCYTNSADGSTCLCSAELCNGATAPGHAPFAIGAAAKSLFLPLSVLIIKL